GRKGRRRAARDTLSLAEAAAVAFKTTETDPGQELDGGACGSRRSAAARSSDVGQGQNRTASAARGLCHIGRQRRPHYRLPGQAWGDRTSAGAAPSQGRRSPPMAAQTRAAPADRKKA